MQFLVNIFAFVNPRFLKVEPTEIIMSDNNFWDFPYTFWPTALLQIFETMTISAAALCKESTEIYLSELTPYKKSAQSTILK